MDYVKSRCANGLPPAIREIGTDLHIKSTSTAHKYVNILVSEGKIQKDGKLTRQLKIPGMTSIMIPYFKKVSPSAHFNSPDRDGSIVSGGPLTFSRLSTVSFSCYRLPKCLFADLPKVRFHDILDIP